MKKRRYFYEPEISNSILFFIEEDCIWQFGKERGEEIYNTANDIFEVLSFGSELNSGRESNIMVSTHFYPVYAYYKALLEHGYSKKEALSYVRKETVRAANVKKYKESKCINKRDPYKAFHKSSKPNKRKKYPRGFWKVETVIDDECEMQFNVKTCIYRDLCHKYYCPELYSLFCERDKIAYSNLGNNIAFERKGTLTKGSDCCEFHFKSIPR